MKFLKMIKNIFVKMIIYIKILLSFFILIFDLVRMIIFLNHKKKFKIFLMLEGGFGHTIVEPHFLNINEKSDWVLVLAYDKKFHNKEITSIFSNKIFLISKTRIFWKFNKRIEKFMISFFRFILSVKIVPIKKYIMEIDCSVFKNNYHKMLESRTFKVFKNSQNHKLYHNYIKKYDDLELNSKFSKNKGIINFHFRAKAKETSTDDWFSHFRDSENINYYRDSIEYIFNEGWVILFGGEDFQIPNWLKNYSKKFITRSDMNLDNDKYGMFVGLKSNIYIGPLSGASLFNMINPKIKSLIFNCLPFGFGHVNSVISYPVMNFKSLQEFNDLFVNDLYKKNFDSYKIRIRKLTSTEIKEIIEDFLKNINDKNYYQNQNMKINNGLLQDTNFKISKKWLEIINYDRLT